MNQFKSPFYIVEEFISPLDCEDIIYRLNNIVPNFGKSGNPLKSIRQDQLTEIRMLPILEELLPTLESYYGFETEGILPFEIEWYPERYKIESSSCKSFVYDGKSWKRISDISFSGVIFLNDYNDVPPFDGEFEVYGGKLEFQIHQFGFNPKRGMMIVYPEAPNFTNTISSIEFGELYMIRFNIVAKDLYNYNLKLFPGNYKNWFRNK